MKAIKQNVAIGIISGLWKPGMKSLRYFRLLVASLLLTTPLLPSCKTHCYTPTASDPNSVRTLGSDTTCVNSGEKQSERKRQKADDDDDLWGGDDEYDSWEENVELDRDR